MRICLDFDGVLHDASNPVPGRKMGPPLDGALDAVRWLQRQGHELMISTARANDEERGRHVHDWLHYWRFPPLPVIFGKPMADVYVDDKGLHHTSWASTLAELQTR